MGEIFLVVLISGIIFGLIGSFVAKNKGVTQSSGFFFGFFLGPIGLIIVALLNPTSQTFVPSTGYHDGRDLVADRYRLWLTQRYDIQRNESLNRFVVASESFETLEDALGHADYLESLEEDRRREDAERGARSSRQSALVVGAGLAAMALYFVGGTLVGLFKHRIAISAAEESLEARRGELAKELSTVHLPLVASARMTETDYSELSIEELNELRFTTAYVGDFPYELAYGINDSSCNIDSSFISWEFTDRNGKVVRFNSSESPTSVRRFYMSHLSKAGFLPSPEFHGEDTARMEYSGPRNVIFFKASDSRDNSSDVTICILGRREMDEQLRRKAEVDVKMKASQARVDASKRELDRVLGIQ